MGSENSEQIGGLTSENQEVQKTNTSSLGQPKQSDSDSGSSGGGGALDSLDIFSQEEAGDDEENKLAAQLPDVDIQDLLRNCKEIAAELAQGGEED